jgi:predicted NUDIX family NTP pyrophosphohydrolase
MPEIEREAARLLVRSRVGRVLLLRVEPSFRDPFWVTPGGGLDDGETLEQAAMRELREEVGREDLLLGPLLGFETSSSLGTNGTFVRRSTRSWLKPKTSSRRSSPTRMRSPSSEAAGSTFTTSTHSMNSSTPRILPSGWRA